MIFDAPPPVQIIIDTDIEYDVDDVGAIALAHALADQGEVELLGMVVSAGYKWSPLCLDRLNTWYGRPNIPLGFVGEKDSVIMGSKYAQQVAESFPGKLQSAKDCEDSTVLYRRLLAEAPDHSVTLVSIGFMTAIDRLLKSQPDDISPLTGRELAEKKFKVWICMGGGYPSGREYNFVKDPGAAFDTVNGWQTPIHFIGEELGKTVMTGEGLSAISGSSPLRMAYECYFEGNLRNRPSWDQVALLYAIRRESPTQSHFWSEVKQGGNVVNPDGTNQWDPSLDAPHCYLIPSEDPEIAANIIEKLMASQPVAVASQQLTNSEKE